jgi:tRNA G18 (ribose-2'-O)-methylase SpoU
LENFQLTDGALALVFGHEMDGVDQAIIDSCDFCIEIPQSGIKHSINISVCAGVVCWEFYRKYLLMQQP